MEIRPQGRRRRRARGCWQPSARRPLVDDRNRRPRRSTRFRQGSRAGLTSSRLPQFASSMEHRRDRCVGRAPSTFLFELDYFGDRGQIRVTDRLLELDDDTETPDRSVPLPEQEETIDANFCDRAAPRHPALLSSRSGHRDRSPARGRGPIGGVGQLVQVA